MILGKYGSDPYGIGPYGGSIGDPFGLVSATALGFTTVRVVFSDDLDSSYVPLLDPATYAFSPSLNIVSVVQSGPATLLFTTASQVGVTYTLTVSASKAADGRMIDPLLTQTTLRGFGIAAAYLAVATGPNRVRAIFSSPMLDNPDLVDSANYVVTDLQGAVVPVVSVTKEQGASPVSVALTLSATLLTQQSYQLELSPDVKRLDGTPILPPTALFQWVEGPRYVTASVSAFSGEIQGGLFGIHNGLVFFSPALQNSASNSIIQIESIDVCTRAYDEYHFPKIVDPSPLFTHGAGVVPTPNAALLNEVVLWVDFPRLFEAKLILGFTGPANNDAMPQASDSHCVVEVQEPWDKSLVALLNDTAWKLFNNTGLTVPPVFITADNLAPIPAGGMSTIVLQPPP